MTTKENASQDRNKTESAESTPCRKCKGTGVILQINVSHTEAICCGQCSGGNRIWSRLLELLADVDTPSPVSARPEKDRQHSPRSIAQTAPVAYFWAGRCEEQAMKSTVPAGWPEEL
jgi:hypothetical protein